ncbi:MAG: glycine-rich domain-containing protein-like [Erythrobacter sp.]|uniref:glycine-rich domain-containing protein-like n=1 Tax=Erythrobacter sp. TaxID=1042 RepID=UPI0032674CFF
MWVAEQQFAEVTREIWALDLENVIYSLTHCPDGLRYPRFQVMEALELYKKFLALKVAYRPAKVVPSNSVDLVWHSHIILTQQYTADCQRICGYYLHHDPLFGTRNDEEIQEYRLQKEWTKSAMQHHFQISGEAYTQCILLSHAELQQMAFKHLEERRNFE